VHTLKDSVPKAKLVDGEIFRELYSSHMNYVLKSAVMDLRLKYTLEAIFMRFRKYLTL